MDLPRVYHGASIDLTLCRYSSSQRVVDFEQALSFLGRVEAVSVY